ncbi:thioredoxin domain-containing protein [Arcanobacterium phocisimile]|uniref:Thioredoxin domain-containing protein n=1 Tax=Arcanobacterium phocisimile TaxID=1302235 RepID=A0ABX7IIA5_9ACTO|nr:thioredoxin domain-containing protein [Arcanobacterium phocisimile]QRV02159.1 thioredoxin domain-containing protein [Arcanobacterium phocisimile]
MSQPTNATKRKRNTIAALIALLTVAVLIITLVISGAFISQPASKPAPAQNTTASGDAQNTPKNADGSESAPATNELDPQLKQAVEAEHRNDPHDPRALGSIDAPVIIEMYSDYRCGHCRDWSLTTLPQLQGLIDDGTVRIEYNSLPILGDASILAAQASHAAALQNKFWDYHTELFANPPETTPEALTALAGKLGMDTEKFAADLVSPETVAAINDERNRGLSLGISGTPAFLIGYSFVSGALPADKFLATIESERQRS